MKISIFTLFALLMSSLSYAQETVKDGFSEAIEDNSFYIEEAYNQEPRVVQHIFNGISFATPQHESDYSFTQEWPLGGQTHQLSYTIPYSNPSGTFGDVLINYRYQLTSVQSEVAIAPRVSIIIPTGNSLNTEYGGLQVNIAASKRWNDALVTHCNVGFTIFPEVQQNFSYTGLQQKTLLSYNVGGSIIWLAHENVNLMFEILETITNDFAQQGETVTRNQLLMNPALRFAINVNSLQIVPGFGVPVRISEDETDVGVFLYLSFEHPF